MDLSGEIAERIIAGILVSIGGAQTQRDVIDILVCFDTKIFYFFQAS